MRLIDPAHELWLIFLPFSAKSAEKDGARPQYFVDESIGPFWPVRSHFSERKIKDKYGFRHCVTLTRSTID
jgi:hypothetical protein